ncbi:MAG: hypothetical protein ACTSUE_01430 [Promethearchaeota archaeon]
MLGYAPADLVAGISLALMAFAASYIFVFPSGFFLDAALVIMEVVIGYYFVVKK